MFNTYGDAAHTLAHDQREERAEREWNETLESELDEILSALDNEKTASEFIMQWGIGDGDYLLARIFNAWRKGDMAKIASMLQSECDKIAELKTEKRFL